jgi:hypothetical protein
LWIAATQFMKAKSQRNTRRRRTRGSITRRAEEKVMADEPKTTDVRKAPAKPEDTTTEPAARPRDMRDTREARETREGTPPGTTPATEKPAATRPVPETSQYVVTVNNKTGACTKVERVDEATGLKTLVFSGGAPTMDPNNLAYYQGMTDAAQAMGGGFSDAFGGFTDASGGYTDAFGGYTDALGGYTDASGGYTDASGGYTDASGGYTDAFGGYTDASGGYLDASGGYTDASGGYTDAFGGYSDAYGGYTDASGGYTDAYGGYTDAYGGYTDASGGYTDAYGGYTDAYGNYYAAA